MLLVWVHACEDASKALLGYRVQGSGFRVQCLGFRVWGCRDARMALR